MKKVFFALVAVLAVSISAGAANYTINDDAIDAMIEAAAEVTPLSTAAVSSAMAGASVSSGDSDGIIALILSCPLLILGDLGIHRHFLGTRPFMWAIYLVTIGGIFGIVPLVDFVTILIDVVQGGSPRIAGSTKFIAWA